MQTFPKKQNLPEKKKKKFLRSFTQTADVSLRELASELIFAASAVRLKLFFFFFFPEEFLRTCEVVRAAVVRTGIISCFVNTVSMRTSAAFKPDEKKLYSRTTQL
ncbi:hypothetical protein ISCGN_014819 [Ixodes scapularis]